MVCGFGALAMALTNSVAYVTHPFITACGLGRDAESKQSTCAKYTPEFGGFDYLRGSGFVYP